jgi:hypothetical protein
MDEVDAVTSELVEGQSMAQQLLGTVTVLPIDT